MPRHKGRERSLLLEDDRERALALTPVSRETLARLDQFVAVLLRWQERINLIAPATVPKLWTRHVADSLQLLDLAPAAKTWVDVGSGGGFPGLPIACALAERAGSLVHLVESNQKKTAFLREAARTLEIPVKVHGTRIDKFVESSKEKADVITARAVAPLKLLLDGCYQLIQRGALALFPKGQHIVAELEEATIFWKITYELIPSRTDAGGRILAIRALEPA